MKKVIVVGAGPAGLMAAIEASKKHEVLVIDKNAMCGRKLLITGNGRCNVTNNRPTNDFLKHCSPSSKFLYSAFSQFDVNHLIEFFEMQHCPLVEEHDHRMYPMSQQSQSILNVLLKACEKNKVNFLMETTVERLVIKNDKVVAVLCDKGRFECDHVILATGGMSYPLTGSSGDGHAMLQMIGHSVTELYGVEVPLICHDEVIQTKRLQGLTLKDVKLEIISNKKVIKQTHGDVLFTHFGLSGPSILYLSEWVQRELKKNHEVLISIRSTQLNEQELLESMGPVVLAKWIKPFGPKRWTDYLLSETTLDKQQLMNQLPKKKRLSLVDLLLKKTFMIHDTLSIDRAFVTAGGIKTSEIDPMTLKSKLVENVSICGELLDCHGELGGYNITIAMVSGNVCGKYV